MKTGIIGLPQVGKTSLFKILTKAKVEEKAYSREAHIGIATVPDDRLAKLAELYEPKKTIYATVEYADVAAVGQEALKETGLLANLRSVDALIHVLRAFEDDSIPHVGEIDPLRDIKNVEFDLMVNDLTQIEKRLERLEKDLKKQKTDELVKENALAASRQGRTGEGKASSRNGTDCGREEADSRLHVPLAETNSLRAEYFREHDAWGRS